ncbi:hypothetical protein CPB84DRAFT_1539816 [Gymnopilus junonius]|uniref:Uncharacterized protein n=1 Tax=Gymnopilus junonius TaxID=109634 RepID=A0A9P5NEZ8_GYMJU|nr:hypothetical protein CPB84DRAFT_1539816 [Gymnopilus junonius]
MNPAEGAPTPYVPVDPFKPSLAFSLNNVFPQGEPRRSRVAESNSLHDPPRHGPLHEPPHRRVRYGYGPYTANGQANFHGPPAVHVEPETAFYRDSYASLSHQSRGRRGRGRSPAPGVVKWERPAERRADDASVVVIARPEFSPGPRHYRTVYSPSVHSVTEPAFDPPSSQPQPTTIVGVSPPEAQLPLKAIPLPMVSLPLFRHHSPRSGLSQQSSESSVAWESIVEVRPQLLGQDHAIHHSHAQQEQPFDVRPPAFQAAPIVIPGSFNAHRSRSRSRSPRTPRQSRSRSPQLSASYRSRHSRMRARSRSPSPSPRVKETARKTNDHVVEVDHLGSRSHAQYSPERYGTPSPILPFSPSHHRAHARSRSRGQSPSRFRLQPVVVPTQPVGLDQKSTPPSPRAQSSSPPFYVMGFKSSAQATDADVQALVEPVEVTTPSIKAYVAAFLFDTVPRQVYLYMLLRLPSLYYSRVTRIFEEAQMSMPMIKQGILDAAKTKAEGGYYDVPMPVPMGPGLGGGQNGWVEDKKGPDNGAAVMSHPYLPWAYWEPPPESVAYSHLQNTWEAFIDSLQREWKTLNIISVLLLSAILTILQIPAAAADPLTRYAALLSMICALMSLLYGCIYIIRFGTMRKTYKGAEWAEEAQKSRTGIFWNVWVMLAMPATWLAWSMILYIVTIMSFVWRTTPFSQPSVVEETSAQILIPRIIISLVVALGLVYFFLIAATLRKYGDMMDRAWQRRIWGWMRDGVGAGGANYDQDQENTRAYASNAFGSSEEQVYPRRKSDVLSTRSELDESKRGMDGYTTRGFQQSSGQHRPAREASSSFLNANASYSNVNLVEVDGPRPPTVQSIDSERFRLSSFIDIPSEGVNAGFAHSPISDDVQNADPVEAKSVVSVQSSLHRVLAKDSNDISWKSSLTADVQDLEDANNSRSKDNGSPSGSRGDDHAQNPHSGSSASPDLDVDLGPSSSGLNKAHDVSTEGVSIVEMREKNVKLFTLSSESPLDAMSELDFVLGC